MRISRIARVYAYIARTHTYVRSYDGNAHQSIDKTDGIQLSFIINTDGVEIFHTSNFHLWPVLLMINEFPPTLRFVYVLACNYNVYYIYFFMS